MAVEISHHQLIKMKSSFRKSNTIHCLKWLFVFPVHRGKTIIMDANISCVHVTLRNIIYLFYIILLACLIAIFLFTFICDVIDTYWFRQSNLRNSSQWSMYNYKTDSTEIDSDLNSTNEIIQIWWQWLLVILNFTTTAINTQESISIISVIIVFPSYC